MELADYIPLGIAVIAWLGGYFEMRGKIKELSIRRIEDIDAAEKEHNKLSDEVNKLRSAKNSMRDRFEDEFKELRAKNELRNEADNKKYMEFKSELHQMERRILEAIGNLNGKK